MWDVSTITFDDGGVKRNPVLLKKPEPSGASGFRVLGPKGQDITLLFKFYLDHNGELYWLDPEKRLRKYESVYQIKFI